MGLVIRYEKKQHETLSPALTVASLFGDVFMRVQRRGEQILVPMEDLPEEPNLLRLQWGCPEVLEQAIFLLLTSIRDLGMAQLLNWAHLCQIYRVSGKLGHSVTSRHTKYSFLR